MITNTGKEIIAKYMLGQIPDFASYIAAGCGPKPLNAETGTYDYNNYKLRENLEFEMFRVPIISKGIVLENGVPKIVLTAELPTENRYEITELGVFSAGSNPALGAYSSRTLLTFADSEAWQYNGYTPATQLSSVVDNSGNILTPTSCMYVGSDNQLYLSQVRTNRYERPRFLNMSLMVPGNSCVIDESLNLSGTGNKPVELSGSTINLDKFSANDELRLALSVVQSQLASSVSLGAVRVRVEFRYDSSDASPKAVFKQEVKNVAGLNTNRYFVMSQALGNLETTSGFSWSGVSVINVYVSAYETNGTAIDTASTSAFMVALDGLRIENAVSNNPLYGMIGYTQMKTLNAEPVIKKQNSTSYAEFRFALDVN